MTSENGAKKRNGGGIWDRHISAGSLLNMLFLVFFAAGFYFVTEYRLDRYDDQFDRYDVRLMKIEELQISMAEVILQQSHIQDQVQRVETRHSERYTEVIRRIERLENEFRELNPRGASDERD